MQSFFNMNMRRFHVFPWGNAAVQQVPVRPPQFSLPPPRPTGFRGLPLTLPVQLGQLGFGSNTVASRGPSWLPVLKADAQPQLGFGMNTGTSSGPTGSQPPPPPFSQQAMQAAALSFVKMYGSVRPLPGIASTLPAPEAQPRLGFSSNAGTSSGEATIKAFFQSESLSYSPTDSFWDT